MTGALDMEIQAGLDLLGKEEKQSLLGVIKSFLSLKQKGEMRISIEQYNREQDEAVARVKGGHYYSQGNAEKEVRKRSM